jgi:hypothetical protein
MTEHRNEERPLRDAWDEVGERFGEVGRRLSPKAEETRKKLEGAMEDVTAQLDKVFTSVGDAFRDAEERERMRQAVRSLGTAITATFDQAARSVRPRRDPGSGPGSGG